MLRFPAYCRRSHHPQAALIILWSLLWIMQARGCHGSFHSNRHANHRAAARRATAAAARAILADVKTAERGDEQDRIALFVAAEDDTTKTSPRLWLESSPSKNGGAYTVMRCDHLSSCGSLQRGRRGGGGGEWKVWGRDFHLHRLRESMRALLPPDGKKNSATIARTNDIAIEQAVQETECLMDRLLSAAVEEFDLKQQTMDIHESDNHPTSMTTTTVCMLTILWTLSSLHKDHGVMIRVQGHICRGASSCSDGSESDGEDFPFSSCNPDPWTAVVATVSTRQHPLPNRQPHPYAKLSAWCSERRPLEERFRENVYCAFEPPCVDIQGELNGRGNDSDSNPITPASIAVDEIILVDESSKDGDGECSHPRLLEGLTSNLFVVYHNNVIRTAGEGVLHGYARHLVLSAVAKTNNKWTVDTTTPIRLDEADQWQEVFVTSAIRIIVPVGKILVPETKPRQQPEDGRLSLREAWRRKETGDQSTTSVWRNIYTSIMSDQYR